MIEGKYSQDDKDHDHEAPILVQPWDVKLSDESRQKTPEKQKKAKNSQQITSVKRCSKWPNCKDQACGLIHPTEICMYFPNCAQGDACTFIHPLLVCKFKENCKNLNCNYQHAPAAAVHQPDSELLMATASAIVPVIKPNLTILCRFYPRCVNIKCPYLHPIDGVNCKYGQNCARPGCMFQHATGRTGAHLKRVVYSPCRFGKQCAKVDCPFQHAIPPALNPTIPSNSPSKLNDSVSVCDQVVSLQEAQEIENANMIIG